MPFPVDLVPKRTSLERLGLERQWFAVIPLAETERLMKITLTGDLLFAQTDYAMLHAIDAESGRHLWSAQLGERTGFARGVASNSYAVYVTNANQFHSLDRRTGRPIWRYNLGTDPHQFAGVRRRCGHGWTDLRHDRDIRPEVERREGERIDPPDPARSLAVAHRRPDSYSANAGRPVHGLRFHGRKDICGRNQ